MMADAGPPADSRAVLIGVSAYENAEFPPIRAARNSLQAMRSLLTDPALCGWAPQQITVIADPASASDLADRIADLAETATGVLLLYYVGHGVLSARGELCLTVTSTRPNRPQITGLRWDTLADILRSSPARARLVILDCCFSGQAIEALSGEGDLGLADITHVGGVYTLTATTRNRTAHVPPPGQQATACTSFTGEFCNLIHSGVPGKPGWLTFNDLYPELRQRLRAKGLPAPSQRGTDTAHQFPFTANAAARSLTVDTSPGRYSRPPSDTATQDAEREAQQDAELLALAERADSTWKAGDAAGARDQYATLIPLKERALGREHPETLFARATLAYLTGLAGDAAGARDQLAALQPVSERVLGPEHRDTLNTRANVLYWTGESGDAAAARDQFAPLLPVFERVLGREDPDTLTVRNNLAYWTGEAGDPAAARDQFAALLPVRERVIGPEDPLTLTTRFELARMTGAAGDAAGARDQYAELLPVEERVRGPKHPETLNARNNLARWTERAR